MTEENTNVAEQPNELEQLKQQVEELRKDSEEKQKAIDSLVAKKEELLKETKQAKEEKRRQAEEAEQAKQEKLKEAEKNGEFEKLWKQAVEEKEQYKTELTTHKKSLRNQAIDIKAEKLALDLTNKDPDRAELLKEFIVKSISNVADDNGHADEDVLLSVRKQFETDKKYSLLLAANKSVGSGAPGNTRSAQLKNKEISRQEFDKLSDFDRKKFLFDGGKLVE